MQNIVKYCSPLVVDLICLYLWEEKIIPLNKIKKNFKKSWLFSKYQKKIYFVRHRHKTARSTILFLLVIPKRKY